MNYTKEQEQAIYTRDGDILVSAGAGAGKTRVLVTRITELILDSNHPLSADQFLVLTFTNAAAREMKERIGKELEKRLEETPGNKEIRRQIRVVKHADISTVHSFCNRLLRTHFNEIGIDPSFRIGEKGELTVIRQQAMENLLEKSYEEGRDSFLQLVESYAYGKDDSILEKMISDIYEFSRCFPNVKGWFSGIDEMFQEMMTEDGMKESRILHMIFDHIRSVIENMRRDVEEGLAFFDDSLEPERYYAILKSDEKMISSFEKAQDFVELYDLIHSVKFESLPKPRKAEKEWPYLNDVKEIHTKIKGQVEGLGNDYFMKSLSQVRMEQKQIYPLFHELISLCLEFEKIFQTMKKEKNIFDFDDLEHYTLQLLVESYDEYGKPIPSEYAVEIASKYKEIFVDEYQDTNLVQETIISVLLEAAKGQAELFVVGDVKQSIYRFRQARPDLFIKRYEAYSRGEGVKIELRDNFRSSPDVLTFCNRFFEKWMTHEFGGIEYNENIALVAGENGPMKEVHEEQEALILVNDASSGDMDEEAYDKTVLESMMIGDRIEELLKEGYEYKDMVILLRSLKGYGEAISETLEQRGIPVLCESQTGYFETREIRVILNYLSIIDNVYQDIPLASVMLSGIGRFTAGNLAEIKIHVNEDERKKKSLYELLNIYQEEGKNLVIREKIRTFLNLLQEFRRKKEEMLLHELLWEIYEKTGFYEEVLAMTFGQRRRENLMMLMKKAQEYEKTAFKGLFYFIRYMDQLRTYEVELGGGSISESQENAVKIMTIHKSKGLEYPVVFVSTLSKQFNTMDLNEKILYHPELGIGMDYIDLKDRTRSASMMKKVIQEQIQKELLEEELRILYVAMTRAQKKIILTGVVTEKQMENVEKANGKITNPQSAKCFLDWILPVLYKDGTFENCKIFDRYEITERMESKKQEAVKLSLDEMIQSETVQNDTSIPLVEEAFTREYPYHKTIGCKRKYSVSELKRIRHTHLEEEGQEEISFQNDVKENEIPKPDFLKEEKEELSATSYGTIVHKIMELLPFGEINSKDDIKRQVDQLFEQFPEIKPSQKPKIIRGIQRFLLSPSGKLLCDLDRQQRLYKELPFTIGLDAHYVHKEIEENELVVVQGIIDLCGELEDHLILLDYKTDYVEEGKEGILLDRYKDQMLYYKLALQQMLQKEVKECFIYSFSLQKFIKVELEGENHVTV